MRGTIPQDPTTGFSGLLFFVGERIAPGSTVVVALGGTPLAVLPATFSSSEVMAANVFFTTAGDYTFTAVAPDGTSSNPLALHVPAGGSQAPWALGAPEVHMLFPPRLETSFAGTVWIMGDHFLPGAQLLVTRPGYPDALLPLLWVNERTLAWTTATPIAGDMTLSVCNPTLESSTPVTVTVKGNAPVHSPSGLAAPGLTLPPTSCVSPFVGTERIFGQDFLPGAVVVVTDASGQSSEEPLLFVSSDEVWWVLAYPLAGTYTVQVRNPDGQTTPSWPFTVS